MDGRTPKNHGRGYRNLTILSAMRLPVKTSGNSGHGPQRPITRMKSLGVDMGEDMVFHKAIRSLKLPAGQRPIVLAPLKTTGDATSLKALRGLTIKMYETHKSSVGPTEVYHAQPTLTPIGEQQSEEEEGSGWEMADDSGQVFLMRPKRSPNAGMHRVPKNPPAGGEW